MVLDQLKDKKEMVRVEALKNLHELMNYLLTDKS